MVKDVGIGARLITLFVVIIDAFGGGDVNAALFEFGLAADGFGFG